MYPQYHFGLIIERALGHATHGQNLQQALAGDSAIDSQWAFPEPAAPGLAGKIPNWTLRAGWQTRRAVRQMQRRHPLDALFFHTQVTAVLCLDWLRRVPSVVSLDATPLQYDALGDFYAHRQGPGWLERHKWQLHRACFQAAHHLVTWSEWAKESLVADYQIPATKIKVIPPGVDPAQWQRPAADGRAAGQELEAPRPVRILFVGGDLARKGGLLLLEAFRALREQLAAGAAGDGTPTHQATPGFSAPVVVELHLVTRDPVPAHPGVFVYHHMQPNSQALKELFWASDIFCLPTLGDCLPMVLSEAGAAGLPLVASAVAAVPEIVRPEETGLLVRPGDVAALTAALYSLVVDPEKRHRLGGRAAVAVQRDFDSRLNAWQLLSLLKEIADEKQPATSAHRLRHH